MKIIVIIEKNSVVNNYTNDKVIIYNITIEGELL